MTPLAADRSFSVRTTDGVSLYAEEVGDAAAPLTVVLVHGFMLEMASWRFQRLALAADDRRVVLFDQRGHGRSENGESANLSVAQLGRDLVSVLANAVPDGPVVLIGHSMGGIAIQALLEDCPDRLRARIAGVGLVATSAGRLDRLTFGLPALLVRPLRRTLPPLAARAPRMVESVRRGASPARMLITRRYSFGSPVDAALVALMDDMLSRVRMPVVTAFWPLFAGHDAARSLARLDGVPTAVVVGEADRIIPPAHSRAIAAQVPSAVLTVVPGGGHMVMLEKPEAVNAALLELVRRAGSGATGS